MRTKAPRILKEPVRWRFSHFRLTPVRRRAPRASATPPSACAPSRPSSISRAASMSARVHCSVSARSSCLSSCCRRRVRACERAVVVDRVALVGEVARCPPRARRRGRRHRRRCRRRGADATALPAAARGTAMSAPAMPATSTPQPIATITPSGCSGDEATHEERLQDVALDLLDQDHAAEHQQRRARALVDERDEDRDACRPRWHRPSGRTRRGRPARRWRARTARRGSRRRCMMPIASAMATSTVARTNWVSETHATRPEPSTCSRAARGARRTSHDQMRLAVGEEEVGGEQDDEEARDDVADGGADLGDPGDALPSRRCSVIGAPASTRSSRRAGCR